MTLSTGDARARPCSERKRDALRRADRVVMSRASGCRQPTATSSAATTQQRISPSRRVAERHQLACA